MSRFTFVTNSSSEAVTERVEGSTVGTLKVKISDLDNVVGDVEFYVSAMGADGTAERTSGPHPPDITRRPGWYEKDVVLDASLPTRVELVLRHVNGSLLLAPGSAMETFPVRTAAVGGGAALLVQDTNTLATEVSKLLFQDPVVTVDAATKVATVALDALFITHGEAGDALANYPSRSEADGRYAAFTHAHTYASLTGRPTTLAGYGITDALHSSDANVVKFNSGGTFGAMVYFPYSIATPEVRNNSPVTFLTAGGMAQGIKVGGLVVSDTYTETVAAGQAIDAKGYISTGGSSAGFMHNDRSGGFNYLSYVTAGVWRLFSGQYAADRMTLDQFGNLTVAASVTTPGIVTEGIRVNNSGNAGSGGVGLWGTSMAPYFIAMRTTANFGNHGHVTADWATYFSMDATAGRGWIFRSDLTNVASVSTAGSAQFNGSVTAGGGFTQGVYHAFVTSTGYGSTIRTTNNTDINIQAGSTGRLIVGLNGVAGCKLCVDGAASATSLYLSTRNAVFITTNNNATWNAENASGGYDSFLWPRASDNNTYLNFGGGGHFYVRNNASGIIADIHTGGVQVTGALAVTGNATASGGKLHLGTGVTADLSQGVYFNTSDLNYAIYKGAGAWSGNLPRLHVSFYTGITLRANPYYSGTQFRDDTGGTLYMTVGSHYTGVAVAVNGHVSASDFVLT